MVATLVAQVRKYKKAYREKLKNHPDKGEGNPWIKKDNSEFDVAQGAFDSAEVCELVGLFLLSELKHIHINTGLYRDDGLAVSNLSPRNNEVNVKKEICKVFQNYGLKIEITVNITSVNFLDITMDINTGVFKPFVKDSNVPLYIHKDSNHPPAIIKNLPKSINRRLSMISANETVFDESVKAHQEALEKSGYDHKLTFDPAVHSPSRKNRPRKIIWFNPPFSHSVKTKVGKEFLKILDSSFPLAPHSTSCSIATQSRSHTSACPAWPRSSPGTTASWPGRTRHSSLSW